MDQLWRAYRDDRHGGYVWLLRDGQVADDTKLAYGHVFVLLAASTAKLVGHPDADRLLAEATPLLADADARAAMSAKLQGLVPADAGGALARLILDQARRAA